MFDVGFTEIMLIGVVALVVIGPERLPDVARTVGGYVGKLQRFVTGVKRDIRAELDAGELKKLIGDQKEQIDELRKVVSTTRREMDSGARSMIGDAKKTFAGLEDASQGKPEAGPERLGKSVPESAPESAPESVPESAPDRLPEPVPGSGQASGPDAMTAPPPAQESALEPPLGTPPPVEPVVETGKTTSRAAGTDT